MFINKDKLLKHEHNIRNILTRVRPRGYEKLWLKNLHKIYHLEMVSRIIPKRLLLKTQSWYMYNFIISSNIHPTCVDRHIWIYLGKLYFHFIHYIERLNINDTLLKKLKIVWKVLKANDKLPLAKNIG